MAKPWGHALAIALANLVGYRQVPWGVLGGILKTIPEQPGQILMACLGDFLGRPCGPSTSSWGVLWKIRTDPSVAWPNPGGMLWRLPWQAWWALDRFLGESVGKFARSFFQTILAKSSGHALAIALADLVGYRQAPWGNPWGILENVF